MSLGIEKNYIDQESFWSLDLNGEVDIYTANDLKESLVEMYNERPESVKINMEKLNYIDSTGLGVLIGALKRLKTESKDIYIYNTKSNVRKIFNITGLDKIFKVEG